MKNKLLKFCAVLLIFIAAGAVKLYPVSDPDAASSWNSSQREDDDFYSGNFHSTEPDPMGKYDTIGSAYTEAVAYTAAVRELSEMEENEANYSSTDLEHARAKVEEAKERMEAACAAEGKTATVSSDGKNVKIKNSQGQITDIAGDPVRFSSGIYFHELEDLCLNYGSCSFSVNRFFRSSNSKTNAELVKSAEPGLFGRGWKTNLESRVIRGYRHAFDFDEEAYEEAVEIIETKWNSIQRKAERFAGITLENYEDGYQNPAETEEELPDGVVRSDDDEDEEDEDEEDSTGKAEDVKKEIYDKFLAVFKKARAVYSRVKEDGVDWQIKQERGKKNRELDSYVCYGENAGLAESLDEDSVVYVDEKGFSYVISKKDGVWKNETLENCGFSFEEDGEGFKVKNADSSELYYGKYGQLAKSVDEHDLVTEYEWDKENLVRVKVNGGITLDVLCEGGRLKRLQNPSAQVEYEYSDDMLIKVKSCDKLNCSGTLCVTYEYDSNKNIEKVYKTDGSYTQISYDCPDKKDKTREKIYVTSVKNENGDTEYFTYDLENKTAVYKDHDGNETSFGWDEKGRTIMEKRPDGDTFNYVYNEEGLLSESEENGEKCEYFYDEDNHLVKVLYSDSTADEYLWEENNIVRAGLRNGAVLNFNYDYRNFCTDIFSGGQRLYSYQYDAKGFLIKKTDCRGYEENYLYDLNGNLIQRGKEKWRYDDKNRIVSYVSENGVTYDYAYTDYCVEVTSSNGCKLLQKFSVRGDLVEQIEEDTKTGIKKIRTFEYDKVHHLKKETLNGRTVKEHRVTPEGKTAGAVVCSEGRELTLNQTDRHLYSIEYEKGLVRSVRQELFDRMNNLLDFEEINYSVFSEGQRKTVTEYLKDGTSIEEVFYKGKRESYKLNGDTLWSMSFSCGDLPCALKDGFECFELSYTNARLSAVKPVSDDYNSVCFEYYPDSLLKKYTDKNGVEWNFEYGPHSLLKKVSCPQGCILYSYDEKYRPVLHTVLDKQGNLLQKSAYSYSEDGKTVYCVYGDYIKETLKYDAFGNLTEKTDGAGNRTLFEYDEFNNPCRMTDPAGNVTEYFYDCDSRLIKIKNAAGQVTEFTYDIRGNCTSARDESGEMFKAVYDCLGRVTEYEVRPFSSKRFYEWDNYGRLLSIRTEACSENLVRNIFDDGTGFCRREYNDGSVYQIKKDSFGNVLYVKNRLGKEENYEFDRALNLSGSIDFNGNRTEYVRFKDNNTVRKNFADSTFNEITFDFAGRITKAQNQNSVLSFVYDTAGKLAEIKDSFTGKKVQYKRNAAGFVTSVFCDGRRIDYEWKNSRLSSVKDVNENVKVDFIYSKTLREVERIFSTGERIKTFHDESDRTILKAGFDRDGKLIFADGKVYDKKGFITFTLNSDFTVTRYFYDENGRIKKCLYAWNPYCEEYYKNLCADAGLNVTDSKAAELNSADDEEYSALQKLCSLIPGNFYQVFLSSRMLPVSFKYDEKGNMSEQKTPFGTIVYKYDAENRLVNWGQSGRCVYDNNGNLTEKHSLYKSEVFTYNLENRLIKAVSSDFKNQSVTVLTYLYDALGRKIYSDSSDSAAKKYLYSGFGFEQLLCVNASDLSAENSVETSDSIIRYGGIEETGTSLIRTEVEQEKKQALNDKSAYSFLYDMTGKPMYLIDKNSPEFNKRHKVLFTDLNGTVIKTVDGENLLSDYEYDCFGSPVRCEQDIVPGFAGKNYERSSGFYEFGYRNYMSQLARFMSEDPVKDGLNWFAYCNYDPVDFMDSNGLTIIDNDFQDMHDRRWKDDHINGTDTTIGDAGCAVTAAAEALTGLSTGITGRTVTPKDIASGDCFSDDPDKRDYLSFDKLSDYGGGSYVVKKTTAGQGTGAVEKAIREAEASSSDYSVAAGVEWNTAAPSVMHYVCLTGKTVVQNNTTYYEVTGTSNFDNNIQGNPRTAAGWIEYNGKIYVPAYRVKSVVTIRHTKDN